MRRAPVARHGLNERDARERIRMRLEDGERIEER